MIVPSPLQRLPRYVQVVEPDDNGHLPALLCPHGHQVRKRVDCWGEWGFVCDGRTRHHAASAQGCGVRLWLISLPEQVYVLCEVTLEEVQAMKTGRMKRWEQLAYLWRAEGRQAA